MMEWFKNYFHKQEPEYELTSNDVPMSTVSRWYLYDTSIAEDINEMAEIIGLSRISEEGEAKEQEESDSRLTAIEPLFEYLNTMATLSSRVLTALHLKEAVKESPDNDSEELLDAITNMQNVYKAAALSTLIGAFSIAVDLEIVHLNIVSSDLYYAETEMDDE